MEHMPSGPLFISLVSQKNCGIPILKTKGRGSLSVPPKLLHKKIIFLRNVRPILNTLPKCVPFWQIPKTSNCETFSWGLFDYQSLKQKLLSFSPYLFFRSIIFYIFQLNPWHVWIESKFIYRISEIGSNRNIISEIELKTKNLNWIHKRKYTCNASRGG